MTYAIIKPRHGGQAGIGLSHTINDFFPTPLKEHHKSMKVITVEFEHVKPYAETNNKAPEKGILDF